MRNINEKYKIIAIDIEHFHSPKKSGISIFSSVSLLRFTNTKYEA